MTRIRSAGMRTLACAFLPLFGGVPLAAQQPDTVPLFDPVRSQPGTAPHTTCYSHERYIVVERPLASGVGTHMLVRTSAAGRCDADSIPGDFVLRDDWPAYFLGLRGDVLFTDHGTGPDIRGLGLFDLRTRQRILQVAYVDLAPAPDSTSIGFWTGHELAEPAPGCAPPRGGLLPGVDSLFIADIRTGNIRFGGRTRCAVRQ